MYGVWDGHPQSRVVGLQRPLLSTVCLGVFASSKPPPPSLHMGWAGFGHLHTFSAPLDCWLRCKWKNMPVMGRVQVGQMSAVALTSDFAGAFLLSEIRLLPGLLLLIGHLTLKRQWLPFTPGLGSVAILSDYYKLQQQQLVERL